MPMATKLDGNLHDSDFSIETSNQSHMTHVVLQDHVAN